MPTAATLIAAGANPSFVGGGTAKTTASFTWLTGDFFLVLGFTPASGLTLTLPTATGLTFTAVPSTPPGVGSRCEVYAWTATAASGGSSTISTTASSADGSGLVAFQYRGSDGLGNVSISAALGATTTQSLIRSTDNACVAAAWADFNAINDTTVTWSPSGQTQQIAVNAGTEDTLFAANWGDQGAAGTTAYGFSGFAGGQMTAVTAEVKGAAGGGGTSVSPAQATPAITGRGTALGFSIGLPDEP